MHPSDQLEVLSTTPVHRAGPAGPAGPSSMQERSGVMAGAENATGPAPVQFPPVEGYRIGPDGVYEVPAAPDKPEIRVTLAPCGVQAHCRDGRRENWGAYLSWVDRDGIAHSAAFPVGRFHEVGGSLPVDLANLGLPIVPGMEKRLLRYLASCDPRARYRAAIQTGWQESSAVFVLPAETIGITISGERVVHQPERYAPTSQSVRSAGTLSDWQSHIAGRVAGNPILVFWSSAAFAAPLLKPLGLEGGGFHLYGLTSRGKTTAEQVAASVWGDGADPAEGRPTAFVRKWNLTKNATEGLAEAHCDLPLCLDEVGEADASEFGRTIYQLAGGQGKGRMRADATLKPAKAWRTMILSTGEVPAADVVESEGRRIKGGQAVRLLDIPATDPVTGEGIIVVTHGAASPSAFADELKRACAQYYGTAGPAFLKALIEEGLESITNDLRAALEETTKALTPKGASPEVARAVKRWAVIAVAGEKAAALGIVPWEQGEAVRSERAILARYMAARGGIGSDTERAVEAVRAFILAHGASRFRPLTDETARVMNLVGYRDPLNEILYLTKEGFREACAGYDVKGVGRLLKEQGLLRTPDAEHLTERVTVPGVGRTRLYAISTEILDGEVEDVGYGPVDR